MIGVPGGIFDLIKAHKPELYSGAASVLCSLTTPASVSQGAGAMLPTDDPEYDADDQLRGIPSFTGVSYDPETGCVVSVDQAELGIDGAKITLGRPVKGWTGKLRNLDGTDLNFRILEVMQDRTLDVFRLRLEILKPAGLGRRIRRNGEGGV